MQKVQNADDMKIYTPSIIRHKGVQFLHFENLAFLFFFCVVLFLLYTNVFRFYLTFALLMIRKKGKHPLWTHLGRHESHKRV